MQAGKLQDRIEIQARTITQDGFGDGLETWATISIRWGRIEQQSGRELWQANQANPDVSVRVTLRYFAGLTPRHRLKMGTRIFNIDSVTTPDTNHREHNLSCTEEV